MVSLRLEVETKATLESIAAELDLPVTELAASMLKFALLNRNWRQLGSFGKPVPHAAAPRKDSSAGADASARDTKGLPASSPSGAPAFPAELLAA
jgi:hypothetical protein